MSTHDSTLARLRRSRLAAASVGMIAVLGAALVATAPPATSDGPTVFVQPNDITINDNAGATPYSSDLQVAGMNGVITNVRATINNINHDYPDDIQMLLVSPSGDKVELMNDHGSGGALTGQTLTFRDDGSVLPTNSQINTGNYVPADDDTPDADDAFCSDFSDTYAAPAPAGPYSHSMATFNGDIARGTWKLYVVDDCGVFSGTINAWRLRIVTAVGSQTVTFTSSSTDAAVGTTRQATATGGGSGNPIVFSEGPSTTNDACDVSGAGLITFKHVGVCDVHADQAGNADYNAGSATHQLINVVKGSPVITFTTPNPSPVSIGQVYDANATSELHDQPGDVQCGWVDHEQCVHGEQHHRCDHVQQQRCV